MCFYANKPHILVSVMALKRMKHSYRRTHRSGFGRGDPRLVLSLAVMASGYLIGCFLGARFGILSSLPASAVAILTESSSSDPSFLSVFGSYGFYGVLFLLLSTTYIGFLFVPAVLALKGFFTGAMYLAFVQSGAPNAFLLAGISLCLPGIFVLPALLLLGNMCMALSFQLLCRMRGAQIGAVGNRYDRGLAAAFVLLLAAALLETYVLPSVSAMVGS